MSIRMLGLAMLAALVGACAHIPFEPDPARWNAETRETARTSYRYAQMANNAYGAPGRFDLGPDIELVEECDNDEIGFAYSVFQRRMNGRIAEVVIAFRGTEFGWTNWIDMIQGNLLRRQNRRGRDVYDEWRRRVEALRASTGLPVAMSVTGHSLGGGIATEISLCRPDVASHVFNPSPRFRRCAEVFENQRVSIVEYGEFLKAFRIFGREATQTYTSLGCTRSASPVTNHRIRLLAECLTRIAADDRLLAAGDSVERNGLDLPFEARPPEVPAATVPCPTARLSRRG